MLSCLWVNHEARQSKVNHENCVGVFAQAHHDVVRLDVPMNVIQLMHVLHSLQQLIE